MELLNQIEPLAQPLIEHFSNTLIPSIAAVLFLTLILRVFKSINASTRYALWAITLIIIMVTPLGSSVNFGDIFDQTTAINTANRAAHVPDGPLLDLPFGLPTQENWLGRVAEDAAKSPNQNSMSPDEQLGVTPPAVAEVKGSQQAPVVAPPLPEVLIAPRALNISWNFALIAFILWFIGSALFLSRLIWSYLSVRHLKQNCQPLTADKLQRLKIFKTQLSIRQTRICISKEIRSPIALGLFRPVILIPENLLNSLTDAELEHVILHELAHIRRFDDWVKLIQKIAQSLLFFNPAVWWIGKNLDLEREIACDDYVISMQEKGRRSYASSLIKVAKHALQNKQSMPLFVPRMAETKIEKRVRMILNSNRATSTRIYSSSLVLLLVVLVGGLGGLLAIVPEFKISGHQRPELSDPSLHQAEIMADIPDGTYLYWFNSLSSSGPDAIQRINLESASIENAIVLERNAPSSFLPLQTTYKYGKPGKVAVVGDQIYWSDLNDRTINVANLDGSNVRTLINARGQIPSFTVDIVDLKIYWVENTTAHSITQGSIHRMNLNGTAVELLQTRSNPITDFEIDHAHRRLFWAENSERLLSERTKDSSARSGIYKADLPRGEAKRIKATFNLITAIALDETQEIVYWAQVPSQEVRSFTTEHSAILKISVEGFGTEELIQFKQGPSTAAIQDSIRTGGPVLWSGALGPFDLVLDQEEEMLYWSLLGTELPRTPGKIQRAKTNGSRLEDVVVGLANPIGISLVEHAPALSSRDQLDVGLGQRLSLGGSKVYWLEHSPSLVMKRANLDGSDVQDIFTPSLANYTGTTSAIDSTSSSCLRTNDPLNIEVSRANVLYPTASFLRTLSLTQSEISTHYYGSFGLASDDFRLDASEQTIYGIWDAQDDDLAQIIKTNLNDSTSHVLVRETNGVIDQIALDTKAQKIYWSFIPGSDDHRGAVYGTALLKRANFDGSDVESLFWLDARVLNLEVDRNTGMLYIKTSRDVESPIIHRYEVTEDSVHRLPSLDFSQSSDAFNPCAFKIDSINRQLYLLDSSRGVIATSNLNGSNFQEIVTDLESPFALAIDIWAQRVSTSDIGTRGVGGGGAP